MSDEFAVPWLIAGAGASPEEGGCIMQVIDWIDRQGWSDSPECVHPVLRELAVIANDRLQDGERQKLLDLAPRLMGTNSSDRVLAVRLAVWCARWVLPMFEAARLLDLRPRSAIAAVAAWADCPCGPHAVAAARAAKDAAVASIEAEDGATYAARYAANAASHAAYLACAPVGDGLTDASVAAAAAASAISYKGVERSSVYIGLVGGCLDEYDRVTGREHVPERIDWSPVMEVIG